MTNDELRQALKIARIRRAMTGQELGTRIFGPRGGHANSNVVYDYESGRVPVTMSWLRRCTHALNLDVKIIIDLKDPECLE